MTLSPDRRRLILVDQDGTVLVQDLGNGVVVKRIPGPRNFSVLSGAPYAGVPAIDGTDGLVDLDDYGTVLIIDVNSERTIARLPAASAPMARLRSST